MLHRRAVLAGLAGFAPAMALAQDANHSQTTAFVFGFDKLDGGRIHLAEWAGRPIMVVNTASLCGFVNQFDGLEALWKEYGSRGFAMLGVPSNDFGGQEPGPASETREVAHSHGVTFPMAAKTVVVGSNAHPFYRWAAQLRPADVPRWNFHKYLVGGDGRLAAVFPTMTDPRAPNVRAAIERELAANG